ncbi:uncharacterized protein LOC131683799 [Topomyia yanbarensis]|uniref:uncharacterized protein LOC131683799 n=1 Tax=Topomyia yanbarensis TaxID=2498891 RepID=UPI00273AB820|nr:uncharacterized protein LOC131683799 [Topomyia yanbarensis]
MTEGELDDDSPSYWNRWTDGSDFDDDHELTDDTSSERNSWNRWGGNIKIRWSLKVPRPKVQASPIAINVTGGGTVILASGANSSVLLEKGAIRNEGSAIQLIGGADATLATANITVGNRLETSEATDANKDHVENSRLVPDEGAVKNEDGEVNIAKGQDNIPGVGTLHVGNTEVTAREEKKIEASKHSNIVSEEAVATNKGRGVHLFENGEVITQNSQASVTGGGAVYVENDKITGENEAVGVRQTTGETADRASHAVARIGSARRKQRKHGKRSRRRPRKTKVRANTN